jgi:hypothetical protein
MSLLHHDGFDAGNAAGSSVGTYATRMGYVTTISGSMTGRLGTGVAAMNGTLIHSLGASPASVVVGVAYYRPTAAQGAPISLLDASGEQLTVNVAADGTIEVRRGSSSGTILSASASGVMLVTTWNYLELKATINDTTGSYELRVDGAVVLSGSGVDTKNQSTATVTRVQVGAGGNHAIDDWYILDTAGSAPWNDFLGPVQSLARMPTSEGTTIEWTPSTGTNNAALLDEVPANDDTDYNSAASASLLDLLNHTDVPVGSTIIGVSQRALVRKTDAGVASLKLVAYVDSTEYAGSSVAIADTYTYIKRLYETNPDTAAQWDEAGVNAAEFGYESV